MKLERARGSGDRWPGAGQLRLTDVPTNVGESSNFEGLFPKTIGVSPLLLHLAREMFLEILIQNCDLADRTGTIRLFLISVRPPRR